MLLGVDREGAELSFQVFLCDLNAYQIGQRCHVCRDALCPPWYVASGAFPHPSVALSCADDQRDTAGDQAAGGRLFADGSVWR